MSSSFTVRREQSEQAALGKAGQKGQQKRGEGEKRPPHMCQLVLTKIPRSLIRGRIVFQQILLAQLDIHMQKNESSHLQHLQKLTGDRA